MIDTIGVVIPAADEQDELAECLNALLVAKTRANRQLGLSVRILVVLDACSDRSAEVVSRAAGVEALCVSYRCVGRARAAGVTRVVQDASDLTRVWLASSDADSRVPSHWLTGMAEHANAGGHLVLGTVTPDLPHDTLAMWQARHRLVDGHPHVHGANLGIRADVYAAAGGWPPLAAGEDEVLAARASAIPGTRVVRTAQNSVRTSAREIARAPRGFSSYLRDLRRKSSPPPSCSPRTSWSRSPGC
jgi:hypothetical protein